jgi:hypothetical protein
MGNRSSTHPSPLAAAMEPALRLPTRQEWAQKMAAGKAKRRTEKHIIERRAVIRRAVAAAARRHYREPTPTGYFAVYCGRDGLRGTDSDHIEYMRGLMPGFTCSADDASYINSWAVYYTWAGEE